MKKTTEATKDLTSKTSTAIATEPKAAKAKKATPAHATEQPAPQPAAPAKVEKPAKVTTATKTETDVESTDRLPTTLEELKDTKGGFVAFHFLTGKDKDAIAKDLAAAFKLGEAQAAKIVRRITARVRLYARVFELVPVKKA
jgi:hypothetical protein